MNENLWKRVRAGLVCKGIPFEEMSVDIISKDEKYQMYKRRINPLGFAPAVKIPKFAGERTFWYVITDNLSEWFPIVAVEYILYTSI